MTIYTLSLIYSSFKGSPYVASKNKELEVILKELKPKRGKLITELGSGDGRFLRKAAKIYDVRGFGVDVNLLLVIWSNFLAKLDKVDKNVFFDKKNIFDVDLTKADYVYIFLMPKLIEQLTPKLKKELKKDTIVVSHGFPIKGLNNNLFKILKRKPFPTYYYRI